MTVSGIVVVAHRTLGSYQICTTVSSDWLNCGWYRVCNDPVFERETY